MTGDFYVPLRKPLKQAIPVRIGIDDNGDFFYRHATNYEDFEDIYDWMESEGYERTHASVSATGDKVRINFRSK